MRHPIIMLGLLFSLCISFQTARTQDWKDLFEAATLLANENKLDSAIVLAQSALQLVESKGASSDTSVGEILHALGDWCWRWGRGREANQYYERAMRVREQLLGTLHTDYLRSRAGYLSNTGKFLAGERRFSEAERMLMESLDIRERVYAPSHVEIGRAHMHLGEFYSMKGAYHLAVPHFERALEIWKAGGPSGELFLAMGLATFGDLLLGQGRYAKAELLLKESLAIFERLGVDEAVIHQLVRLGWLYEGIGRYGDCERVLTHSLSIRERKYPAGHYYIGLSLERLGWFYMNQEDLLQAKRYTERAAEIFEKNGDKGDPNLCLALINLGILAHAEKRIAEAEAYIKRGLSMVDSYRDVLTPDAEWVLHSIGNRLMGNVGFLDARIAESVWHGTGLHLMGNEGFLEARMPEKAAPFLEAAASYWEAVADSKHPHRLQILTELVLTYIRTGRYALADSLFRVLDATSPEVFGPDHPFIAENDELYGRSLRMQGRYADALKLADRAIRIRRKNFLDTSVILSERDALSNAGLLQRTAGFFLSCFADDPPRTAGESRRAANIILASKGVVTETLAKRWSPVPELEPELNVLWEQQRQVKGRISRLHVKGPDNEDHGAYKAELDSLSQVANEIERELARSSEAYEAEEKMRNITSDLVVQFLPQNSALLEYIKYDYLELPSEHRVGRYAVVLLKRDHDPVVIDLGTAARIEDVLERYRDHLLTLGGDEHPPTEMDQIEYNGLSKALTGLIWKPIVGRLGGSEMVFVAPDGGLNLLSFGGLVGEDGKYLIEKYAFHYLSAARDLIRMQQTHESGSGLLALGDPDYDAPVDVRLAGQDKPIANAHSRETDAYAVRNVRSGCGRLSEIVVSRLSNTREEVQTIASFFPDAFGGESVSMYIGLDATEEAVKTLAPGKRVIVSRRRGGRDKPSLERIHFCNPDYYSRVQTFMAKVQRKRT